MKTDLHLLPLRIARFAKWHGVSWHVVPRPSDSGVVSVCRQTFRNQDDVLHDGSPPSIGIVMSGCTSCLW